MDEDFVYLLNIFELITFFLQFDKDKFSIDSNDAQHKHNQNHLKHFKITDLYPMRREPRTKRETL